MREMINTKKQLIAYLVLGLLAYLLFLVWTFPADRAAGLLRSKVPPLQLAGVTGTVWSGRATALDYSYQGQRQRLSRFTWQFKPLALFTGRAAFAIAFDGEGRKGSANVGMKYDGSITADAIIAQLPIAELAPLFGVPVMLNGMVDVNLEALVVTEGKIVRAQGQINWRDAAVTSPITQSLGSYNAQLSTEDAGIKAQLRDEGGPLQMDGVLRLINDGSYHFNANINLRDQQQTVLKQALQAVGRQQPDGRMLLEYSGKL